MNITVIAIIIGLIGLGAAIANFLSIISMPDGNDRMRQIAKTVHSGALTFLRQEYTIIGVFVGVGVSGPGVGDGVGVPVMHSRSNFTTTSSMFQPQ